MRLKFNITGYESCDTYYKAHTHGGKTKIKIGNNVMLSKCYNTYVITHHWTDVVTFFPTGEVFFKNGEHYSNTTRNLIHDIMWNSTNCSLVQQDYGWNVYNVLYSKEKTPFHDGKEISFLNGFIIIPYGYNDHPMKKIKRIWNHTEFIIGWEGNVTFKQNGEQDEQPKQT